VIAARVKPLAAAEDPRRSGSTAWTIRPIAAMNRAASQKWIALSAPLGVTNTGMPGYESVWAKSIRPTARNTVPSQARRAPRAVRRKFQPSANTMPATAIEKNSSAVCSAR
jgi:hypothetical protein